MRGGDEIGLEDCIFVLRKNKVKLARLLRALSIKDMRVVDGDELAEKGKKRVKLCYDFLAKIDQTGQLLNAFDEDFFDEIKHERNMASNELNLFHESIVIATKYFRGWISLLMR